MIRFTAARSRAVLAAVVLALVFAAAFSRTAAVRLLPAAAPVVPAQAEAVSSQPVPPPAPSSAVSPPPYSPTPAALKDPDQQQPSTVPEPPKDSGGRIVYMTFDDGPSNLTKPLLDILDRCGVKATFFVIGAVDKSSLGEMKEIVDRGHAIGIHSMTHVYRQVYASTTAFFKDFYEIRDLIRKETGVDTKLSRFPGGSVNSYDKRVLKGILARLKKEGYTYYDWNVSSGDSATVTNSEKIYKNALDGVHTHQTSVVLFHNSEQKKDTLNQVERFVNTLKAEGYTFKKLDPTVDNRPFIFAQ
jgi:peptidoglycan/xylan/chitin deacetylase (PgdA/CDA1 family)